MTTDRKEVKYESVNNTQSVESIVLLICVPFSKDEPSTSYAIFTAYHN